MLYILSIVFVIVNSIDIPDDSHAIFSDSNGIFVLTDKEMILNKIKNGLNINLHKILPNTAINELFNRRSLLESSTINEQLLDIHNEYRSTTVIYICISIQNLYIFF